jgi:hypothetical protein
MTRIEGQRGRLTLDDSYIEFENWSIDENLLIKPGLPIRRGNNYWAGSFGIQEFDYRKILNLWVSNQQARAEFHENNLVHSGKIRIVIPRDVRINSSLSNIIVYFSGMGELT